MRIHLGLAAAASQLAHGIVAIGNFDGVHRGHRALFDAAREQSRNSVGGPVCALTFEPHPARLLAPAMAPPLICTRARKRELLARASVDELIEQPFDRAFASLDPDAFVELLARTGASAVLVGADFTYGRARSGNVASLRRDLEERGVRLHVLPQVTVNGLVVSSSKVREFVLAGRVDAAAELLGRSFDLEGCVVRGAGRGRTLGWPTANLRTDAELLPAVGVYAVRAQLMASADDALVQAEQGPAASSTFVYKPHEVAGAPMLGAANLGINPTFRASGTDAAGRAPLSLEVHLLDESADLYGRTLRISFVQRLRAEQKFAGPDALKAQIARDVDDARRALHDPSTPK